MKKLAKENMKVTEWLQSKKREQEPEEIKIVETMEVDAPDLVDTDTIERKEAARARKIKWKNRFDVSNIVKELVESVMARAAVERVLEEVISRSTWRIKINKVWSMLEDDPLLQEVVKTKMRRQEQELQLLVAEMAREDRLLVVKDLKLKFASRRLEKDMVSLEEMMLALDITISREELAGGQTKNQEEQEDMDWMVVDEAEHALLDQLQMELGIEVLEDEDWRMLELEHEHGYLDKLILALEQEDCYPEVSNVVRWRRPVQDDKEDEDPAGRLEYGSQNEEMEYDGYLGNTPAREVGCGINFIKSHTIDLDSDTTSKSSLSQVLTISCEETNKQTGHNLLRTNIVGIKGAGGCRKRRSAGYSGGWSRWRGPPPGRLSRLPWCSGKRRLFGQVGTSSISTFSRSNRDTQDTFLVDKSRNLDVASLEERLKNKVAMVLEGSMVNKQKNELPVTTENTAVLCQTDINSDKDNINHPGYWAQECVVSGAGDQQDDDLHHHGEGRQLEPCREPGHIVHDVSGHVMDKPGKDNILNHSNFSMSGQAEQGPGAEHQGVGARGGGSLDDGEEEVPEGQQHDPHSHTVDQCGQQLGGGQDKQAVEEEGGGHVQQLGGREGGGVQVCTDVQARVRDGFGGEVLKRSYWRKKTVPDGLVQRRIDQFSAIVPKFGEGEFLTSSSGGNLGGRKRKYGFK